MRHLREKRLRDQKAKRQNIEWLKSMEMPKVDVPGSLNGYRRYFPTWKEYKAFVDDIQGLVDYAQGQTDSHRILTSELRNLSQYEIDKVQGECDRLGLPKRQQVSREIKHEIAKAVGMKPGALSRFKSGDKVYHRITKVLSDLGYHR
jgi:hypothetical protein